MTTVTLTLRAPVVTPLDLSGLALHRFVELDEHAISRLDIAIGRSSVPLGDLFTVRGGQSSRVRVEGSLTDVHGLGTGFASGELTIASDAGDRVGIGMTGGRIRVLGGVGDDAAVAMAGGVLQVDGSAGNRLGAAAPGARRGMTGGEVVVGGSAGHEAAMRMRRGLIVIGGNTGDGLARDIIAGTVVAFGQVGERPGTGSKRGTIIALGSIAVPRTYRLACAFEPPFVRLLMTYLERQFGLKVRSDIIAGRFRRYCGDAGLPCKGEILEWISA